MKCLVFSDSHRDARNMRAALLHNPDAEVIFYLGDGLSDVPCMKMMQAYGGTSIAVYPQGQKYKVEELLIKDRVNFIFPADYTEDSELSQAMMSIIRKIAICDTLTEINQAQLKSITE